MPQHDPQNLRFAPTHEWVAVDEQNGEQIATVGISAFAVEALTDLVFLELPQVGAEVKAQNSFCEVESVKAVSDVYAPVDGTVTEVNEPLPDNLEQVTNDPYGEGWIAKIRIADPAQLDNLLDHTAYTKQCEEEG